MSTINAQKRVKNYATAKMLPLTNVTQNQRN